MTLIVQKPGLTIDGEERESGWVVPKEIENDPSTSFRRLVSRGSVIELPDQLFDNIQVSESESVDIDLGQTVQDVKNQLSNVSSVEQLKRIEEEESNGKDRKTVYQAIDKRKDEIE